MESSDEFVYWAAHVLYELADLRVCDPRNALVGRLESEQRTADG